MDRENSHYNQMELQWEIRVTFEWGDNHDTSECTFSLLTNRIKGNVTTLSFEMQSLLIVRCQKLIVFEILSYFIFGESLGLAHVHSQNELGHYTRFAKQLETDHSYHKILLLLRDAYVQLFSLLH